MAKHFGFRSYFILPMGAEHKSLTNDLKSTFQLFQFQTQDFKPMFFSVWILAQLIRLL